MEQNFCIRTLGQKKRSIFNDGIVTIAISVDGKYSISGWAYSGFMYISDLSTGDLIRTIGGHGKGVNSISFSPDEKFIASGSTDRTVKIWEFHTGDLTRTLEGNKRRVNSISFSPDGKFIASGSDDKTVKIWYFPTGNLIRTLEGHKNHVNSISFSPDGKFIASGSDDKTVKIWYFPTGNLIRTLEGHQSYVNSISFSPDEKSIASGSTDRTVKIWDFHTGDLLRTLEGHKGYVKSISFSPDGKFIASGSTDKTVKVWDSQTGDLIRTLEGHKKGVRSISFSPDGKIIVSGSFDWTIKVWDFLEIKIEFEKIKISAEKKAETRNDLIEKFSLIEKLIRNNNFSTGVQELRKIIEVALNYNFIEIWNEAEEKLKLYMELEKCWLYLNNLPSIYEEISLNEIISRSKTEIASKDLITLLENMIINGEIDARIKEGTLFLINNETIPVKKEKDIIEEGKSEFETKIEDYKPNGYPCPYCKAVNELGIIFCSYCGNKIKG